MRSGGSCGRCGAVRHGRRRHVMGSAALARCPRCGTDICEKHAEYDPVEGAWVCGNRALCQRDSRRG